MTKQWIAVALLALAGCGDEIAPDGLTPRCRDAWNSFAEFLGKAGECDPNASPTCVEYGGANVCGAAIINANKIAVVEVAWAKYKADGCDVPHVTCPAEGEATAPFICAPSYGGVNRCTAACENVLWGDRASSCVATAADCAGNFSSAGYCPNDALCCAPRYSP